MSAVCGLLIAGGRRVCADLDQWTTLVGALSCIPVRLNDGLVRETADLEHKLPLFLGKIRESAPVVDFHPGKHPVMGERCRVDDPAEGKAGTQRVDVAVGPVLTFFNGAVTWTYGWNLTVDEKRRYWGIGFSFVNLARRISGQD